MDHWLENSSQSIAKFYELMDFFFVMWEQQSLTKGHLSFAEWSRLSAVFNQMPVGGGQGRQGTTNSTRWFLEATHPCFLGSQEPLVLV